MYFIFIPDLSNLDSGLFRLEKLDDGQYLSFRTMKSIEPHQIIPKKRDLKDPIVVPVERELVRRSNGELFRFPMYEGMGRVFSELRSANSDLRKLGFENSMHACHKDSKAVKQCTPMLYALRREVFPLYPSFAILLRRDDAIVNNTIHSNTRGSNHMKVPNIATRVSHSHHGTIPKTERETRQIDEPVLHLSPRVQRAPSRLGRSALGPWKGTRDIPVP